MIQVLSDPRYGSNLAQVEATVKKHEAISADILARVGSGLVGILRTLESVLKYRKENAFTNKLVVSFVYCV